ncbi:MAG: ornithine carbamoyltransferase [Deltaproteobacteria bacterium]|nr:ornithine carbamoyltransferase [Deltaproteobacteria bacterium]
MKTDFRVLSDLGADGVRAVLQRAMELKARRRQGLRDTPLQGRSVALIFEKPSTRTRVSFEVGVHELGGHPVVLASRDLQLGRGESLEDTARTLSGYVHAIVVRTFAHARVEALAREATVPVINALTDEAHPCQVLADLQAVLELRGSLEGLRAAWVGDGNNVARSWAEAAGLLGFTLTLACPPGYEPPAGALPRGVAVVRDPVEAVDGAEVLVTDVWASMGQEAEAAARRAAFSGFTVDRALVSRATPGALVLHCLPAHRGEEVSAEYLEDPSGPVWRAAENRLHAQKALLERLLAG